VVEIRALPPGSFGLIAEIDRSERVGKAYTVAGGVLRSHKVDWNIPDWSPKGTGEHSVIHLEDTFRPVLDRGGVLLGAFDEETVLGLAVVEIHFEPGVTWLAFLHVGRPYRRRGVGSALWERTRLLAGEAGDERIYVSATPSESAVGFYLSRGCEPAAIPHPGLYTLEPDDIHLIAHLG
jgi:GNAT superfamily N-acetyltransferase